MVSKFAGSMCAVVLLSWQACPNALAFQSTSVDAKVSITPRTHGSIFPDRAETPRADLRIDSSLVMIPVHVTTDLGGSVTNLGKENFRIFEDNVEQKITVFAKDDAPMSIGILFDSSGSMHDKVKKSSEAASTFFKTAGVDDEFFLIEFSDRPKLSVPFTKDAGEISQRIGQIKPSGCTSLYDAIHLALLQMKKARNSRKALVILSDGGDNRSRHTFREIRNTMIESDVLVYAMGIFDPEDLRKRTREERDGPRLLDQLTEETGGRHFPVDNLSKLPDISERIGIELRNQYLVGYSPASEAMDGKFRRVKLSLLNVAAETPPLRVRYRLGYFAPVR